MNANDADLADESAFDASTLLIMAVSTHTQASILSLHSSAYSDNLNYGPSLSSSPPKVQVPFYLWENLLPRDP